MIASSGVSPLLVSERSEISSGVTIEKRDLSILARMLALELVRCGWRSGVVSPRRARF